MAVRNGYFQLVLRNEGTFLHIYPAKDGGQIVNTSEVSDYLTFKGIDFDLLTLNNAILQLSETEIMLNPNKGFPEQEMMKLMVSENRMHAIARFYPPATGGSVMSQDEIIRELRFKKINVDIKEDIIAEFIKDRQYCKDYIVAEGIPVQEGRDAQIEYHFNTDPNTKPALNEDGTVDFFKLNNVSHCKNGQVLATLIPEERGEPGRTVFGELIRQKDVKKLILKHGRSITLSDDRCSLISQVDGHATLVDGTVFVSEVLEVTNVDASTGNIEYSGNVLVAGNVNAGFSVKAEGNIEVRGVVEGAYLEAKGQISIARGINGMGRGVLHAGGNIISKYIENATVFAGGFVQAEGILHSKVSSKTTVLVEGRKGFITGGTVRARTMITARTIGSSMGVDTVVEVGTDPELKEKYIALQKSIVDNKKSIASIEPVIVAVGQKLSKGEKIPDVQMQQMKLLSQNLLAQKEQVKQDTVLLSELSEMFEQNSEAQIKVMGEAFPGTRIVISESSLILKTQYQFCRFIREGGEIKMESL